MKSAMFALSGLNGAVPSAPGQIPVSGLVPVTSATLPAVVLVRFKVPVASGTGSGAPFAPPDASRTRKYRPGRTFPAFRSVLTQVDALVLRNCTEKGVTAKSIVVEPRLNISMKSLVNDAPDSPPPGYT